MNAYKTAVRHIAAQIQGVGLPVCEGVVPTGVGYPVVLVQVYADPQDTLGTGYFRALTQADLSVRVVGRHGDPAVEDAAVAVDAALHGSHGGSVASCYRIAETALVNLEEGTAWQYVGGIYRVVVA